MRKFTMLLALLFSGFLVAACDQGPAEEAGETIDDAVEDVGDSVEDAADEVDPPNAS